MAPVGISPSTSSVRSESMPDTNQWMKPSASRSVTITANSAAPGGTSAKVSAGDVSAPSHVCATGMLAPSGHGAINVKGAGTGAAGG